MQKKVRELVFTINRHSMALTFRSGTPRAKSASIKKHSSGQSQSAKKALDNLKRAVRGLKESTDGLLMEFMVLSPMAKINGGKLSDVNVIAQQVLDESIHSHPTGGGADEGEKADPAHQGTLS